MADTVKNFQIRAPADSVRSVDSGSIRIKCHMKWDSGMPEKRAQAFSRAQKYVDQECIRRMTDGELHPVRSGTLKRSATFGTTIGSGRIIQSTPYARRQYYEHKEKNQWFGRMVNRDKDVILEGARRFAGR